MELTNSALLVGCAKMVFNEDEDPEE